ncbi:MAG TPA: hypothetical protein DIT07_13935 [Sphingobacteriaceae bacterium]|nr:hypothetical protein [Sphingobacteriaceae bacterium]
MVDSTASEPRSRWSVWTGIHWSVSSGTGGQLNPESGGQLHRNIQLQDFCKICSVFYSKKITFFLLIKLPAKQLL